MSAIALQSNTASSKILVMHGSPGAGYGGGSVSGGGPSGGIGMHLDPTMVAEAMARKQAEATAQAAAIQQAAAGAGAVQGGGTVGGAPAVVTTNDPNLAYVLVPESNVQSNGAAAAPNIVGGGAADAAAAAADDEAQAAAAAAAAQPAPASGAAPDRGNEDQQTIINYLHETARRFGVNETMLESIARRESSFDVDVVNDWDSNARKGIPSKGLMQFIEPTFDWFYNEARAQHADLLDSLGPKDWMDWRQQAVVAAWAIKDGKGSHWATYNAAKRDAGI